MDENQLIQSKQVLNLKSHLNWRNLAGDLESFLIYMPVGWEPYRDPPCFAQQANVRQG